MATNKLNGKGGGVLLGGGFDVLRMEWGAKAANNELNL